MIERFGEPGRLQLLDVLGRHALRAQRDQVGERQVCEPLLPQTPREARGDALRAQADQLLGAQVFVAGGRQVLDVLGPDALVAERNQLRCVERLPYPSASISSIQSGVIPARAISSTRSSGKARS